MDKPLTSKNIPPTAEAIGGTEARLPALPGRDREETFISGPCAFEVIKDRLNRLDLRIDLASAAHVNKLANAQFRMSCNVFKDNAFTPKRLAAAGYVGMFFHGL